jgi:hypothetical protein
MSKKKHAAKILHRQEKQDDAEQLAIALQTCCSYANSALVEDGINLEKNEYYYRVVEHVCEIDFDKSMPYKQYAKELNKFAAVCETLALQFRQAAINTMESGHQ